MRDQQVKVFMTADEKLALKTKALSHGMNVSQFIRNMSKEQIKPGLVTGILNEMEVVLEAQLAGVL